MNDEITEQDSNTIIPLLDTIEENTQQAWSDTEIGWSKATLRAYAQNITDALAKLQEALK